MNAFDGCGNSGQCCHKHIFMAALEIFVFHQVDINTARLMLDQCDESSIINVFRMSAWSVWKEL